MKNFILTFILCCITFINANAQRVDTTYVESWPIAIKGHYCIMQNEYDGLIIIHDDVNCKCLIEGKENNTTKLPENDIEKDYHFIIRTAKFGNHSGWKITYRPTGRYTFFHDPCRCRYCNKYYD